VITQVISNKYGLGLQAQLGYWMTPTHKNRGYEIACTAGLKPATDTEKRLRALEPSAPGALWARFSVSAAEFIRAAINFASSVKRNLVASNLPNLHVG